MDLGLKNKNVIVTGGTRGIGLAAAAACAAEGANVSICGRTQESLDDAVAALTKHGSKIHGAICDVSDAEQIKTYIAAAFNSTNYRGAILKTIKAGGCNCSRVNFIGAYFAALKGLDTIPKSWIKKTDLAKKILDQK